MNKKIAVLIYPAFSMWEISCLTDTLALCFDREIVVFASSREPVKTEDGFSVLAGKTLDEFVTGEYECLILPGTIDPLPALFDEKIIGFLRGLKDQNILIASISSSPMLLAKAGLLNGVAYTSGVWEEINRHFDFIPKEGNLHQPLVKDKNIITAIGFAFREFAAETIRALGLDWEGAFFEPVGRAYTKDELTFEMGEKNFAEFLKELEPYETE